MASFNDKKSEDVQKHKSIYLADEIWANYKDIIWCNGTFWKWGSAVYYKIDDVDWMIEVSRRFPAFDESAPSKQREIMDVYKRNSKIDGALFNNEDGLCFKNVYLDLKTFDVLPHDKKRINTILIPYEYEPNAECLLWTSTINDILDGDNNKIRTLQEFFGYCLTRVMKYEKALFLVGEGGSGKSVILDCLHYILDESNISHISLRHFSDSVRLASIENKKVNICTEVPKKAQDYEENFKKIVTGEHIQVSPKYIKEYDIKPMAKLIFAINQWPHIDDQSTAMYRRMLIISMPKIYEEEYYNRDLKDNLKTECVGILNWAIEGLKRLRAQKAFAMTEEMKEAIKEIKNINNPIGIWAQENIRVDKDREILKSEAYQHYRVWCAANGHHATSSSKFSMELYRIYAPVTKKYYRQSSGYDRKYVWPNLSWVTNAPQEAQTTWPE